MQIHELLQQSLERTGPNIGGVNCHKTLHMLVTKALTLELSLFQC